MLQVSGIYICYLLQLRRYFLWLKSGPESLRFHRRKAYFLVKRKTILSYCPSERYYLTFSFTQAQFCFKNNLVVRRDWYWINQWLESLTWYFSLFSLLFFLILQGEILSWSFMGVKGLNINNACNSCHCLSLRPTSPYGKRYGVVTSKNVDGK